MHLTLDKYSLINAHDLLTHISAPNKTTQLNGSQCSAAKTVLAREAKYGTAAAARMSGNTFKSGDGTLQPFNSTSVPNLNLPNGEQLDLDWFTDLSATHWALYPFAKLGWSAARVGNIPIGFAFPFSDPGERTAFLDALSGQHYSDIFTSALLKGCQ